MPLTATTLEIDGLTAGYDRASVVRDLSLTVAPGEVVALLGANGAGKTTTLRAVSGLIKPMAGKIRLDGADLGASPRQLGFDGASCTYRTIAGSSPGSLWPSTSVSTA
jgi:ABC-type multidrug transport system ATPase subunit